MTNYGKTKVKDLPVLISDKSIFCEGGGRLLSDIIYPVGSIYISVNSTNPSVYFGGSWEQIKDRFLLACGDTYNNGIFGGEAKHKLTVNEMPSHTHKYLLSYGGNDPASGFNYGNTMAGLFDAAFSKSAGGSQAHNNMPPYFTVYIWKRTG